VEQECKVVKHEQGVGYGVGIGDLVGDERSGVPEWGLY